MKPSLLAMVRCSVVLFTLLACCCLFQVRLVAADFYVIPGGKRVGTEIQSLPYTIATPGFHYITRDLNCAGGSHGITILANNVTLDLMGFSLIGPGGTGSFSGVYMNGRTNVEVRNGTVRSFPDNGICEISSSGHSHRVINVRALSNGGAGIFIYGPGSVVQSCTASKNKDVGIQTGNGSAVTGNASYDNGSNGIYAGPGSTATGNTCHSNGFHGLSVSIGVTVSGNTCYDNDASGIYCDDGAVVTGNTAYSNAAYGIRLSENSVAAHNTAVSNSNDNISSCSNCVFDSNRAP